MAGKRVWSVINVSLSLVAILLLLNLFDVQLPPLGKSVEQLKGESICVMKTWAGDFAERGVLDCCQEKRKLVLSCERKELFYTDKTLDWACFTGNRIEYYFNNQAFKYCKMI